MFNQLIKGKSETQDALDMYNLTVLLRSYEYHNPSSLDNSNNGIDTTDTSTSNALNKNTIQDKIPIEKVQEIENSLQNSNYFDDMDYVQYSSTKQVCIYHISVNTM